MRNIARLSLYSALCGLMLLSGSQCLDAQTKPCGSVKHVVSFFLNAKGQIEDTGRTGEGPICVQVVYNPFRYDLFVSSATVIAKGMDFGPPLLTGTSPSAVGGQGTTAEQGFETQLNLLAKTTSDVADTISALKSYVAAIDAQMHDPALRVSIAKETFISDLKQRLIDSSEAGTQFSASDLSGGTCPGKLETEAPGSLLAQLKQLLKTQQETQLPKDTAEVATAATNLSAAPADDAAKTRKEAADKKLADTNNLIAKIQFDVARANTFKCGSDTLQTLANNIAIIKAWKIRLESFGLDTKIRDPNIIRNLPLEAIFYRSQSVKCGNIFNQSSTTSFSSAAIDELPTLDGTKPDANGVTIQNFYIVTCASPFAASAGVEFSTIRNQEFGIIKSAGGANNTSVNKFGLLTDSPIHPLPVVVVHVRFRESDDQRYAAFWSVGVSGNLQGQASGGSTAEFLLGPSVSLFRTMFITPGVHIGAKSNLAGGFHVGDLVPSDVSAVQVTKSYTAGFGIAVTFSKP